MKRLSTTSKGRGVEKTQYKYNEEAVVDWEMRPGGLLVQKRSWVMSEAGSASGSMIKIKVSHDSYHHDVTVPAQSTFGDLKRVLAQETGLEPKEQRLLFRGKEKEDDECLHIAGVKEMSKVILLEDPASKERKLQEMKKNQGNINAFERVARIRSEVGKLSEKVVALETAVQNGIKVSEKELVVLTELLMVLLLELDGIEAEGEARVQRRLEVRRVQSLVDALDNLKARNSSNSNSVSVTTKWRALDSGVGSLSAPKPLQSSTKITQDWEQFD
ncbi:unnamed protein product [Ilex paraguariensis]|uniref:BAG family molecular chaperone regulator 4 n=1 Tax=Ilex paraguariensis TaxID=185542 RepID=A0ABC8T430_9AQUA